MQKTVILFSEYSKTHLRTSVVFFLNVGSLTLAMQGSGGAGNGEDTGVYRGGMRKGKGKANGVRDGSLNTRLLHLDVWEG